MRSLVFCNSLLKNYKAYIRKGLRRERKETWRDGWRHDMKTRNGLLGENEE